MSIRDGKLSTFYSDAWHLSLRKAYNILFPHFFILPYLHNRLSDQPWEQVPQPGRATMTPIYEIWEFTRVFSSWHHHSF